MEKMCRGKFDTDVDKSSVRQIEIVLLAGHAMDDLQ